jgi:hypothetical protein
MSILPTWPIAAGALVAGLVLGAGADHLWMNGKVSAAQKRYTDLSAQVAEEKRQREVQRGNDERAARAREQEAAREAGIKLQEQIDENARIAGQRDDAVKRLQQRPDRKPAGAGGVPAPAPACAGSTGAELSRQDGEFLAREAARGDELRAALKMCYGTYDALEQPPAQRGQGDD